MRDTGIGIPHDRLDRLFKSFSQIDTAARRANSGSGLGLAISKRLSELMGGTMWVESEQGRGSTFYFTIVAEVAPSEARIFLPGAMPQLAGKRLLVVDDQRPQSACTRRASAVMGYARPRHCLRR